MKTFMVSAALKPGEHDFRRVQFRIGFANDVRQHASEQRVKALYAHFTFEAQIL